MAINTGIGTAIGIPFSKYKRSGDKPYIPPELLSAIRGVWIADQNTNESPNRNIIKNKIKDGSGDFEIINASYKLNSGYGLYKYDWTDYYSDQKDLATIEFYHNKVVYSNINNSFVNVFNIRAISIPAHTAKIKVQGLKDNGTLNIAIKRLEDLSDDYEYIYNKQGNGVHTIQIPDSTRIVIAARDVTNNVIIEQIPDYQGAFVTDGIVDYIYSQKPVSEMMTNGNDITVVSMMVNLDDTQDIARTNFYGTDTAWSQTGLVKEGTGKINIVAYSKTGYNTSNINKLSDILGDRDDWLVTSVGDDSAKTSVEYSVQGYRGINFTQLRRLAKIAWYWTIIINKKCTIDEVHMIIEYFNLDKYVRPEIYWDVVKQKLSNNAPDVDWYLKDFSGNGRDGQLNNFAKKLNSGIGLYHEDFTSWYTRVENIEIKHNTIKITGEGGNINAWILYNTNYTSNDIKVKISGVPKGKILRYVYYVDDPEGVIQLINIKEDGIYDIPGSVPNITIGYGFQALLFGEDWIGFTIEQIPDYKDYIVTDGIEDFIRNEEVLNLKDYTFAINRIILKDYLINKGRIAKCGKETYTEAPFLFESYDNLGNLVNVYSFGATTNISKNNYTDGISYMTKYYYMNQHLAKGTGKGIGEGITIGSENNVGNFIPMAMKWMLLFKYSLSSFLLNRQFRKFNLIEKDTVKFLPIIDNNDYIAAEYYNAINGTVINIGNYFPKDYGFVIKIQLPAMREITKCTFQDKDCVITKTPDNDISSSSKNTYYIECANVQTYAQLIHLETEEVFFFEKIIKQPYPARVTFYNKDTNEIYSFGSIIRKGTVIKVNNIRHLLPNIYHIVDYKHLDTNLNYNQLKAKEFKVGFDRIKLSTVTTCLLNNPPAAILSPSILKLSNATYKKLGHIPDISGNENNCYFNNFALTKESGATEDGSIQYDGVDDFTQFNNIINAKQVYLDYVWNVDDRICFDQRLGDTISNQFALYVGGEKLAYYFRMTDGMCYINGVLNTDGSTINSNTLKNVRHSVTLVKDINNNKQPVIGKSIFNGYNAEMKLYSAILFNEISTSEEIAKLDNALGGGSNYLVDFPNGH